MANKPYVVVEWNDTETDAKGWMCAYNFVGHYCGGGTRMHPTVTKEEVIRLATTMGYKYKACESQTTGVKQVLLMITKLQMHSMY